MTDEQKKEQIKAILISNGIRMNIGGCGCCGSPWVTLESNGITIEVKEDGSFEMIPEQNS